MSALLNPQVWIAIITSLPDIAKLIEALQELARQHEVELGIKRKVAGDVATIHSALSSGDSSKLNELFRIPTKVGNTGTRCELENQKHP